MVNNQLINHLESNNVLSPTQTGYRKHRGSTCLPCPEHRRCIPGETEGSGSLLRSLKCIWQGLERGTSCETTEDLCALQDVHVDPALPICKDCPSKTWWHSQQKSLSSWRSITGRCSVPHTVPGLHQWYPHHFIKEGLKHTTCRRPGNLECVWAHSHCKLQDPRSHQWYQQVDLGLEINTSKTNSALFSLSTSKEQIKLRLKYEIVPQTNTPTFLGVKLDTRLTWKPQIEQMERSSLQKLALVRKLAGTSWGADSSILTKVYTATVRPTMEYASTTWGTAAKTNKSRLDKVQNMALRVILGALKTTPVHDMEKNNQCGASWEEKKSQNPHPGRKLPSHPLHTSLAQPTKNRLKRQSLNHQYKELSITHQDIVDVPVELLTDPTWKPDRESDMQMFLSVPAITSKEQLPGELSNLTLALIADRFPHTAWTHV